MSALPLVEPSLGLPAFEEAANLYCLARRAGLTVRSSVACLIGVCAIRNDVEVIHRDRVPAGRKLGVVLDAAADEGDVRIRKVMGARGQRFFFEDLGRSRVDLTQAWRAS